jgi:hypothetical protein
MSCLLLWTIEKSLQEQYGPHLKIIYLMERKLAFSPHSHLLLIEGQSHALTSRNLQLVLQRG